MRRQTGDPRQTEFGSLLLYSVCPVSVVTPQSIRWWNLYRAIGGIKANTPAEYYDLPAIWIDIVTVIEDELQRIADAKSE